MRYKELILPALVAVAFSCGGADDAKREQKARDYAAPLGDIESLSCQSRGSCARTSCTVVIKGVGVLLLNCSNEGCEAVGSR